MHMNYIKKIIPGAVHLLLKCTDVEAELYSQLLMHLQVFQHSLQAYRSPDRADSANISLTFPDFSKSYRCELFTAINHH